MAAYFLKPAEVELDVRSGSSQRVQAAARAPVEVAAQVRLGVAARLALEARQVGGHGQPLDMGRGDDEVGGGRARFEVLHRLSAPLPRPASQASVNLARRAEPRVRQSL